jgi:hypothetical protein
MLAYNRNGYFVGFHRMSLNARFSRFKIPMTFYDSIHIELIKVIEGHTFDRGVAAI